MVSADIYDSDMEPVAADQVPVGAVMADLDATVGLIVEVAPDTAEAMGAFQDTALTLDAALEARFDREGV